jgi:hypothetical protein
MFVELDGELCKHSCQMEIARSLQTTLKQCGLFLEDDIYTTLAGHTKPTIIAIYCEQRKTLEKNGAT